MTKEIGQIACPGEVTQSQAGRQPRRQTHQCLGGEVRRFSAIDDGRGDVGRQPGKKATLSRIRSPVTSRSNWANDKRTFSVSRPMLVVVGHHLVCGPRVVCGPRGSSDEEREYPDVLDMAAARLSNTSLRNRKPRPKDRGFNDFGRLWRSD
jgi:hypothetical protein